ARRLAADRARRRFLVMDLARLFGEAPADVLGVAHELTQLRDDLGGQPECCIARRLFVGRFGRWRVVARGTLGAPHTPPLAPLTRADGNRSMRASSHTGHVTSLRSCWRANSSPEANQPSKRCPCAQLNSKMIISVTPARISAGPIHQVRRTSGTASPAPM